jgi:hypothetical protein
VALIFSAGSADGPLRAAACRPVPSTAILSAMAIGLKLDIGFSGPDGRPATFGDLKRFVARAEAGGCADADDLHLEKDENDEVTGLSVYLDPDS